MHKYVFADTNLFEQFSSITDIDWLTLANCESATLLVCSVTIRELNRHKDGAANGRRKRKAAAVLSGLKRYSEQGTPARIRVGVELEFQAREPRINFAAHQLDEQDSDDRLVATALEFALAKGLTAESVLVATGDFGLQLKLRSQPLVGIIPLPDELRLPDEPDAEERLIRELKEEVRTLRDASPKLDVSFKDLARFSTVRIEGPRPHELGAPEAVVSELEDRYPYLAPNPGHPPGGRWVFCDVGTHMCQQYNDSLNQFFERTGHWVRESERVQNWYRRSAVLELLLHNSGGAPGTDIDLEMTFPPHLEIVAPGQMPTIPAEPLLPLRPNDRSRAALVASQPYVPEEFRIESVSLSGKSRISRMEDTTDGTLVTVHLNDLKHTYDTDIPRLLVHFQSYEEAGSFRFRYRIVAANHPKPTEGSLDVVVEK